MNDFWMILVRFTMILLPALYAGPAYAVPSLLPLLPVLGVLIAKGVLLIGSLFFFLLSFYKKQKKAIYTSLGIVLLVLFVLTMIFVNHG